MVDKRIVGELSIAELEQVLAIRKREQRLKRLRRMEAEGRLVGVPPAEQPIPPPLPRPPVEPAGATSRYLSTLMMEETPSRWAAVLGKADSLRQQIKLPRPNLHWVGNRFLLFVEVIAILGLIWVLWESWQTRQELNREVAEVQKEFMEQTFPTPSPTPLISVILLPGGHILTQSGEIQEGEAGSIPEHLRPLVAAYKPPPIPTRGPEHARRIVIPAIGVDARIVEGDGAEQLEYKKVGHHIGSANPGELGNLVLTGHNDIHGEVFRHLKRLQVGDEIIIHTISQQYIYSVQDQQIVEPTDVHVMAPTRNPTITLISCYPYLVDTQRIVIIGILKEEL